MEIPPSGLLRGLGLKPTEKVLDLERRFRCRLCYVRDQAVASISWTGGEPRKAGQRNTRRVGAIPTRIVPVFRPGDPVRWKDRAGLFRREIGDGEHAEITLGERIYRVRIAELV